MRELPLWAYRLQFCLVSGLWVVLLAWGADRLRRGRPWRALTTEEGAWLLAAAVLAAAARVSADPFPADIRSAYEMGLQVGRTHLWAAGYSALLHALFAVAPATLATACAANVVLGTLTVPALYWLAAELTGERKTALAAAAVLAVVPILARFSASDSAHVLAALCLILGLACGAVWARGGGRGWLAAGLGWLVLGVNARPESVVFLPAAALVCWARWERGARPGAWAPWVPLLAAEVALLVVPALEMLGLLARGDGSGIGIHLRDNPWFVGPAAPAALAALSLLGGAVLLLRERTRRLALAWLAAMALVSLPCMSPEGPARDTNYRYFLPLLALFCFPAGAGAAFLVDRTAAGPAWRSAALVALPLLGALPCAGFLHKRWTHQLEEAFLRAALVKVEDGCAIVRRAPWLGDSGLEAPAALSAEAGRRHSWVDLHAFLAGGGPSGCAVFYQSASCSAEPASGESAVPECRRMRESFRLEPLAEVLLPALPYVKERYLVDPVPVGLYRVVGRRA